MRKFVGSIMLLFLFATSFTGLNATEIRGNLYSNTEEAYWIEQIDNGITPLSMTGAVPVHSFTTYGTNGDIITIDTYADNSRSSRGIKGGKCQSGSGYSVCENREIWVDFGFQEASFKADYQTLNGASDSILNYWNGTLKNVKYEGLSARRLVETSAGPADVELRFAINETIGKDAHWGLALTVGKNQVNTDLRYYGQY